MTELSSWSCLSSSGHGVDYLRRRGVSVPGAVGLRMVGKGGVPRRCGVEEVVVVVDVFGAGGRGKHAQVYLQQVAKHLLAHVHVRHERAVAHVPDDALVVDISQRHAVVGLLCPSVEGQVILLREPCALYESLEVGVGPEVYQWRGERLRGAQLACIVAILRGAEHGQCLEDALYSERAVVAHVHLPWLSALRGHLDDACRAARPILRGLGGIFQDGETLDVGGIDAGEQRQVAHHAVDDDERIVAAGERRRAAQADGAERVGPVSLHLQARHAAADGVEGVGGLRLVVHLALVDLLHHGGERLAAARGIAHRHPRVRVPPWVRLPRQNPGKATVSAIRQPIYRFLIGSFLLVRSILPTKITLFCKSAKKSHLLFFLKPPMSCAEWKGGGPGGCEGVGREVHLSQNATLTLRP